MALYYMRVSIRQGRRCRMTFIKELSSVKKNLMEVEVLGSGAVVPFEKNPHDLVAIRVEAENQDAAWEAAKELIFLHMTYTMHIRGWRTPRW